MLHGEILDDNIVLRAVQVEPELGAEGVAVEAVAGPSTAPSSLQDLGPGCGQEVVKLNQHGSAKDVCSHERLAIISVGKSAGRLVEEDYWVEEHYWVEEQYFVRLCQDSVMENHIFFWSTIHYQ